MITKLKKHSTNAFSMVSWSVVQSITNPESLAIWTYLQSLPEDWVVSEKHIRDHFSIGRTRYLSAMKYLREAHLYKYVRLKSDNNSFTGGYYHVYDNPYHSDSTSMENDTYNTIEDSLTIEDSFKREEEIFVAKETATKKLKLPEPKLPEKKKEKIDKNPSKANTVENIKEEQQETLEGMLEKLDYLFGLTKFQIMNPKEFKQAVGKNKKPLNLIYSDTLRLFGILSKQEYPEMDVLTESSIKQTQVFKACIKRLGGDLILMRLVIRHWDLFKETAKTLHGTKINSMYPNPSVIAKNASVASSDLFLNGTISGVSEEITTIDAYDYVMNMEKNVNTSSES